MQPTDETPGYPVSAPDARRYVLRYVALYAFWFAWCALANSVGFAPLPAGTGPVLFAGIALTVGLFSVLSRLPAADQPPLQSLLAAQVLAAILWTALYGYFASHVAGHTGGLTVSLFTSGMYACALLFGLPGLSARALALLAGAAVAGAGLNAVVGAGLSGSVPALEALAAMIAVAAVSVLVLVVHRHVSLDREWQLQRLDDLRQTLDRVSRRADRDHLTNTFTRRFIVEMLGREKARSDRSGEPFCVLLLDIDHFKAMNDRYGHLAGDRILASFARRVRTELRDMDSVNRQSPGQPSLGRFGGEEFIVILPYTTLRGALRAAERIRKGVLRQLVENTEPVTVSIGIAEYRAAETCSDLLARADAALYSAKAAGRNRVHCATHDGGGSAVVMPDIPKAS